LVELADIVFLADLYLVSIVVDNGFENGSWLDVLLVAHGHESKDFLELGDEGEPRLNTFFVLLVLALQFDSLRWEGKDLGHKARHGVVHLQQTVEVTRVSDVPQTNRVVYGPDPLINREWLIVSIVGRTVARLHALLNCFLNLGIILHHAPHTCCILMRTALPTAHH